MSPSPESELPPKFQYAYGMSMKLRRAEKSSVALVMSISTAFEAKIGMEGGLEPQSIFALLVRSTHARLDYRIIYGAEDIIYREEGCWIRMMLLKY